MDLYIFQGWEVGCTYMAMFGPFFVCIYIYIYIYVFLVGLLFFSHLAAWLLQLSQVFGSNTPFVTYLFATGLMGMFLWTVVSFCVFGKKLDLTCVLQVRFQFLLENTDFHVDCIFAKIHHHEFEKMLLFVWEGRLFSGEGRLFFLDSHCGDKVG